DRRLHLLAVRPHPGFPQPGERDRSPLPRAHAIGAFASTFVLPGVEAVGWNEATAAAHGVAERRPVVDRFTARIDEQGELPRVLDPGRDQTPAHERELPLPLHTADDRHRLRRRY